MKFSRFGFAAALALVLCGQQALAADAPPKMDPKAHEQAQKDAPALVQQTGLDCQVSDAYLMGQGEDKSSGKTVKLSYYEVACGAGLGYVLKNPAGGPATPVADCLALKTVVDKAVAAGQKPGAYCTALPGNADPKQGLTPVLAKANVPCARIKDAIWKGSSVAEKINVYEASCGDGVGYYIETPMPGSAKGLTVVDCLQGVDCTLVGKDELTQRVIKLSAAANKPNCQPVQARWVGAVAATGDNYYEIGCQGGADGYMFQTDKAGAFKKTIPCVQAIHLGGGCSFTNVDLGQTADLGTYQKLAKQINDPCTVTKYQSYGAESNGPRELVELACSDAAVGGFAIVPTGAGQTGEYFNCIRAEGRGLACHLTPKEATYSKIANQIAGRGKTTCQVNGGHALGRDDKGNDYVQVSCGGGADLVLTYSKLPEETLVSALPCAQAPVACRTPK